MKLSRVFAKKEIDRKSTRLNSSHHGISYAVFCLKKIKEEPCIKMTGAPTCTIRPHHITPPFARISVFNTQADLTPASSLSVQLFFFFFKRTGHPKKFPLFPSTALSKS